MSQGGHAAAGKAVAVVLVVVVVVAVLRTLLSTTGPRSSVAVSPPMSGRTSPPPSGATQDGGSSSTPVNQGLAFPLPPNPDRPPLPAGMYFLSSPGARHHNLTLPTASASGYTPLAPSVNGRVPSFAYGPADFLRRVVPSTFRPLPAAGPERVMLFLGSSHMRLLWINSADQLKDKGYTVKGKRKLGSKLRCHPVIRPDGSAVASWCYLLAKALQNIDVGALKHYLPRVHYLVMHRAPWDLISYNTPPGAMTAETSALLHHLHGAYPQAGVLFVLPHFFACPSAAILVPCVSLPRQAMYRAALLCAIANATRRHADYEQRLRVFDPWGVTYEPCSVCAQCTKQFVNDDGHHLKGSTQTTLSLFVLAWLNATATAANGSDSILHRPAAGAGGTVEFIVADAAPSVRVGMELCAGVASDPRYDPNLTQCLHEGRVVPSVTRVAQTSPAFHWFPNLGDM